MKEPSQPESGVLDEDKQAEIEALRAEARPTRRARSPRRWRRSSTSRCRCSTTASSASSTTWATTPAIVQAARVSYGRGTKQVSGDRGLINYLMRHRHTSPFEMCEIKLHVKLPIFVARQWIRHRTANVNEYSARYSILEREFYMPEQVPG